MPQPLSATRIRTPAAPTPSARPTGLTVMARRVAEQHVLVVLGEADLHTAEQLRTALVDMLPVHPASVLVELGALEFCDLAGLNALHDAARAAHHAGVTLTFRGMSAQLSWLHHTFPPRSPISPPTRPSLAQPVPIPSAAAMHSTPSTASAESQTSGQNATTLSTQAGARTPATPQPPASRFASRSGCTSPSTDVPSEYLTGRARGRRGTPDGLVHAVPINDRTRSAVCGARTWPATTSWTGAAPSSCPDCAAAVAVGTVHPFPAERTAAGRHPRAQAQQVS